jgi:hypothetical protein
MSYEKEILIYTSPSYTLKVSHETFVVYCPEYFDKLLNMSFQQTYLSEITKLPQYLLVYNCTL